MMKRNILAVVIPALLVAGAANAAEIYNKDSNKLDLYGKAVGLHYFSDYAGNDGDQTYARLGFKGETKINDQLTGYGQWEYNFQGNNSEGADAQSGNKTRLAFAGLKFGDAGSTTVVTMAWCMMQSASPICCQNGVATLARAITSSPAVMVVWRLTVTAASSAWLTV